MHDKFDIKLLFEARLNASWNFVEVAESSILFGPAILIKIDWLTVQVSWNQLKYFSNFECILCLCFAFLFFVHSLPLAYAYNFLFVVICAYHFKFDKLARICDTLGYLFPFENNNNNKNIYNCTIASWLW